MAPFQDIKRYACQASSQQRALSVCFVQALGALLGAPAAGRVPLCWASLHALVSDLRQPAHVWAAAQAATGWQMTGQHV